MFRLIHLFTLILLLRIPAVAAGFEQYLVTTGFTGPSCLQVCSMNDDNYPDILGTAWGANEVSYWLNSGETIPQWQKFLVEDDLEGAAFASAADVNGDGFVDIAAVGWDANRIICYLGDAGCSWTPYVVSSDFVKPHEVHLVDLDQDGLLDLLAAGAGTTAVSWWKNNGNNPDQWQRYDVCASMPGGRSVCWGDFDLDGDLDLAGCGASCNDVRWWENDGQSPPGWTNHLIEGSLSGAHMTRTADINGDGSLDLAALGFGNGQFGVWFNLGGSPIVWEKHWITENFGNALGVELVDLDNDDLVDIVGTSRIPSQISFWLNNGASPSTWKKHIIDGSLVGAWPLSSGDLNSDGYTDLVGGANNAGFVRWYRNDLVSGVEESYSGETGLTLLEAYPNPTSGSASILLKNREPGNVTITILDIAGRAVTELFCGYAHGGSTQYIWNGCSEDGSPVEPGIYLISVKSESGDFSAGRLTVLR